MPTHYVDPNGLSAALTVGGGAAAGAGVAVGGGLVALGGGFLIGTAIEDTTGIGSSTGEAIGNFFWPPPPPRPIVVNPPALPGAAPVPRVRCEEDEEGGFQPNPRGDNTRPNREFGRLGNDQNPPLSEGERRRLHEILGKEKGKHGPDPTLDEIQRIIDNEIRPL